MTKEREALEAARDYIEDDDCCCVKEPEAVYFCALCQVRALIDAALAAPAESDHGFAAVPRGDFEPTSQPTTGCGSEGAPAPAESEPTSFVLGALCEHGVTTGGAAYDPDREGSAADFAEFVGGMGDAHRFVVVEGGRMTVSGCEECEVTRELAAPAVSSPDDEARAESWIRREASEWVDGFINPVGNESVMPRICPASVDEGAHGHEEWCSRLYRGEWLDLCPDCERVHRKEEAPDDN